MGELINFMEYWEAKQNGISVKEWRAAEKKVEDFLENIKAYDPVDHFGEYMEQNSDEYNWPAGYQYVLEEDIESGYHDDGNGHCGRKDDEPDEVRSLHTDPPISSLTGAIISRGGVDVNKLGIGLSPIFFC